MTLHDIFVQKKLTGSLEESKKLIFDRKVQLNGYPANSLYLGVKCGDIVRVGNIEIVVVSKYLKGLQTRSLGDKNEIFSTT